jgi:tetratricopeptide (TPR) repeat protein
MDFINLIRSLLSPRKKIEELQTNLNQQIHEARGCLRSEQYDQARILLLRVIAERERITNPKVIRYLLSALASTWLYTEKYEDGITFFSGYIDRYPNDPMAHSARAGIFWYMGKLPDAIRDYSRALELGPNERVSRFGRGQVLAELGENDRALEDLDLALQDLKSDPRGNSRSSERHPQAEAFIRNGRGLALAGLGDSDAAMAEFERSINLSPDNAWVYYNRAQVYDRAGNARDASADYQASLIKKKPALNPLRKQRAQERLRELGPAAGLPIA